MIALLHRADARGAVERYVAALAGSLGEDCVIVHPGVPELERSGAPTIVTKEPGVGELVRILRRVRPRVAHVTDVWPQAVAAARLARVPKVLVTHHTPGLPRRDNLKGRAWSSLGWSLRPLVIYTSAADRESDGRQPAAVVPLGIDVERFARGTPIPFGAAHPVIGHVGRLAPQKDQQGLIAAFALLRDRFPAAMLVIVGGGELASDLQRQADDLGIGEHVLFTGERDDIANLLASFHVYAQPSRYEGLCLAVLEAQSAGVPVVATPVGGMRATVVDEETGLVVPVGNPTALAAAIGRLLDDSALAARVAAEARRRVATYDEARMIEGTRRLYDAGG